jgi:DNA-binding CsgD family transcriptional regulator
MQTSSAVPPLEGNSTKVDNLRVTGDRGPRSARPAGARADERRRLDDVLDAAAAATSVGGFLHATLAALDEQFGFSRSSVMLVLAQPRGQRAFAGVTHGSAEVVREEYFERWAPYDALRSDAAAASYRATGSATIDAIYRRLDAAQRRYVDDFLTRHRATGLLSQRLAAGRTDAYVTLFGRRGGGDGRILRSLAAELCSLLRAYLPSGLEGFTPREAQTAELVALGFSNREIAEVLHVEEDTIKKCVSRAMARIGVERRAALAVAWATGRRMDLNGAR